MHRLWFGYLGGETIANETIVGELLLLCPLASGRRGRGRVFTKPPPRPQARGADTKSFLREEGPHISPDPNTDSYRARLEAASDFTSGPDLAVSGEDIGVPRQGRLGAVVVGEGWVGAGGVVASRPVESLGM